MFRNRKRGSRESGVSYFFADLQPSVFRVKRAQSARGQLLAGALVVLALLSPSRAWGQDGDRAVMKLDFQGNKAIDNATLAASIATSNSSWFARTGLVSWIGLGTPKYVNERELQRDV